MEHNCCPSIKYIYKELTHANSDDRWCKNSDKIICLRSQCQSKYLKALGLKIIGKTFKEIGFDYEPKV